MADRKIETVYCIKYALIQGIFKVEGFERDGLFFCPNRMHQHFVSKEWSRTLTGDFELAEMLREKKLASLRRSLDKISKLEITVEPGDDDE